MPHKLGFKIVGIITIIFGGLFLLYGGGSIVGTLIKGFVDAKLLPISLMLLAAGVFQLIAVKKLRIAKKIGLTFYAVAQILFLSAIIIFFELRGEENTMLILLGVFLVIAVASLIYFSRAIKNA